MSSAGERFKRDGGAASKPNSTRTIWSEAFADMAYDFKAMAQIRAQAKEKESVVPEMYLAALGFELIANDKFVMRWRHGKNVMHFEKKADVLKPWFSGITERSYVSLHHMFKEEEQWVSEE